MASEGYDNPELDTLVLASPKCNIEQAVGRILRKVEGKTAEIKTIHTSHEDDVLRDEAERLEGADSIRWFG